MTKRICVFGNSLIAALLAAYRGYDAIDWQHDFDFFGSEGDAFRQIRIGGGRICDARFKTEHASNDLPDYDGFVILGDIPPPHEIVTRDSDVRRTGGSAQLRRTALHDIVAGSIAFSHAQTLRRETRAPIFILSRNIAASDPPMTEAQYHQGTALLREFLAPSLLIETPEPLLRQGFLANTHYYKGSIYGGSGEVATDPLCDDTHLNIEGGRLLLQHIAARITAHFIAAP